MTFVMREIVNVQVLLNEREAFLGAHSFQNSHDDFHHLLQFVDRPKMILCQNPIGKMSTIFECGDKSES